jgi:hypothetical protein
LEREKLHSLVYSGNLRAREHSADSGVDQKFNIKINFTVIDCDDVV